MTVVEPKPKKKFVRRKSKKQHPALGKTGSFFAIIKDKLSRMQSLSREELELVQPKWERVSQFVNENFQIRKEKGPRAEYRASLARYEKIFGEEPPEDCPAWLVRSRVSYHLAMQDHKDWKDYAVSKGAYGLWQGEAEFLQNAEAAEELDPSKFSEKSKALNEVQDQTPWRIACELEKKANAGKTKTKDQNEGDHTMAKAATKPKAVKTKSVKPKAVKPKAAKTKKENAPKKTGGRPVGVTLGLGIQDTWVHVLEENGKKNGTKRTDAEITEFMQSEFPGRDSKVFTMVPSVRSKYNAGGFHGGEPPKIQSPRIQGEGEEEEAPKKSKKAKADPKPKAKAKGKAKPKAKRRAAPEPEDDDEDDDEDEE